MGMAKSMEDNFESITERFASKGIHTLEIALIYKKIPNFLRKNPVTKVYEKKKII